MGEIELRDGERDVVVHNDGIQKREDDFLSFSFSFCSFCCFFFITISVFRSLLLYCVLIGFLKCSTVLEVQQN